MEPMIIVAMLAILAIIVVPAFTNGGGEPRGTAVVALKRFGVAAAVAGSLFVVAFAFIATPILLDGRRSKRMLQLLLDSHRRGLDDEQAETVRKRWPEGLRIDGAARVPEILEALAKPGPHSRALFSIALRAEYDATPKEARLHAALASILPNLDAQSLAEAVRPASNDDDAARREANLRTIFERLPAKERAWALEDLLDWLPNRRPDESPNEDERWLTRYASAVAPWKADLVEYAPRVRDRSKARLAKLLDRLG